MSRLKQWLLRQRFFYVLMGLKYYLGNNVVARFPIECVRRFYLCLLYTSPSPRDRTRSRMPSSA